jgi:hypothetical protein
MHLNPALPERQKGLVGFKTLFLPGVELSPDYPKCKRVLTRLAWEDAPATSQTRLNIGGYTEGLILAGTRKDGAALPCCVK